MNPARTLAGASLVVAIASGGLLPACRKGKDGAASGAPAASASAAPSLPPLLFKDDTAGVLLTWIDDGGDFHVVEHVADVPEGGRGTVRVVVTGRTDGTGDAVYVADLRSKGTDGAYLVKSLARSEWDELGAGKRRARLEALAPSARPTAAGAPSAAASGANARRGDVTAIIYGASWCGPCHQAQALLRSLGVNVVMKDIEKTPGAEEEMQEALRRIHRHGGSIPVIDIAGQVFVGFSEGALRAAVDRARSAAL